MIKNEHSLVDTDRRSVVINEIRKNQSSNAVSIPVHLPYGEFTSIPRRVPTAVHRAPPLPARYLPAYIISRLPCTPSDVLISIKIA